MNLYLNELAPWERKSEYYNNIQIGKDVRKQTESISSASKQMIAAQFASANAIIASQERIAEGIQELGYGISEVADGISGLKAAFEFGISEIVWQIEQNRDVLRNILEVLSAPLDTQAKELRKRAEEAYANGWFDEALEDFLESEKKNRYDFSIHISLGLIYLFHKVDKQKALEYFENAIKYAKPKSPYHASYALIHKALVLRDLGKLQEAEVCTEEAISISPDFSVAIYQNAQLNALLNNPSKAIQMLRRAIEFDQNYCEKSNSDKVFDCIRQELDKFYSKIRNEQEEKVRNRFEPIRTDFNLIMTVVSDSNILNSSKVLITSVKVLIDRVEQLIKRNSYKDYLDALSILPEMSSGLTDLKSAIVTDAESAKRNIEAEIYNIGMANTGVRFNEDNFMRIFVVICVIGIGAGIRGCANGGTFESLIITPIIIAVVGGGVLFFIASLLDSRNKKLRKTAPGLEPLKDKLSDMNEFITDLKQL
jgi:tetratricopeptide (TPR) repeat protein